MTTNDQPSLSGLSDAGPTGPAPHRPASGDPSQGSPRDTPATRDGIAGAGGSRKRRLRAQVKHLAAADELRERVYGFGDLSVYGLRDRLIIRVAALALSVVVRVICSTLRWEVRGAENLDSTLAGGRRVIFTFWHTCIFTATWLWRKRGIVVMSSRSRDGEFTGRLIKRYGYGTARGSSSRGAGRALAEMAACLESGIDVAFTIDGPRGPAHVAKTGAVTLARHTGQAILPFYITTKRRIQLPSWDLLQIPLPFTRALAVVAEPIYVSTNSGAQEVESKQAVLQETLDRLQREAEMWRAGSH